MSRREHLNQIQLTGPGITLADLRWLVESSAGMRDGSRIEVHGRHEYDQRDFDPERIIVHGEPIGPARPGTPVPGR